MSTPEATIVSEHTAYIRTLKINTDHVLKSAAGKPFSPKVITIAGTEGKPTFRVNVSGYLFKRDGTQGRRTETDFAHPGKANNPGGTPAPAWILDLIGTTAGKSEG